jgi:hypothetical protein
LVPFVSWSGAAECGSGRGAEKLYDPSYGTGPFGGANRLKEYQAASIAGFCGLFEAGTFEAKCEKVPAALQLHPAEFEKYE